jgi:hypothetical protein
MVERVNATIKVERYNNLKELKDDLIEVSLNKFLICYNINRRYSGLK